MIRHLDASPTPIDWSELYAALQQEVVDGLKTICHLFLSKHYEISPYLTLDEHTRIPDILVIGSSIWNSLSEKTKMDFRFSKASSQIQKNYGKMLKILSFRTFKRNVEIIEISRMVLPIDLTRLMKSNQFFICIFIKWN